ncbi:MAG: MarR family transcriptional regulator [Spirochaetales bacterium]|nr:MarR family transcriptional regulator [Spirochaetales bacterium]
MNSSAGNFGLYLSIINNAAHSYFYHKLKQFNIGPGQQAYLISIAPGEVIIQDELVKRLKVDKANVARALKDLEIKGYIIRNRNTKDKRIWKVELTEAGINTRTEIVKIADKWIDRLKSPLSIEQWDDLQKCLGIISDSLNYSTNP